MSRAVVALPTRRQDLLCHLLGYGTDVLNMWSRPKKLLKLLQQFSFACFLTYQHVSPSPNAN